MRYEALKKVSDEMLARKDELGRLLARELQPAKRGKKIEQGPREFLLECSWDILCVAFKRRASELGATIPAQAIRSKRKALTPGL